MVNPYDGSDNAGVWQQGFLLGFFQPDGDLTPPSPFTPDSATIYSEGTLAGQDAANGIRGITLPLPPPPEAKNSLEAAAEGAEIGGDVAHLVYEIVEAGKTLGGAALAVEVVGSFSAFAVVTFISVAIIGPDHPDYMEEQAKKALTSLTLQLAQNTGVPDAFELFVAVSDHSDETCADGDTLQQCGWWHGQIYLDYQKALAEAVAHGYPEFTMVLRVQSTNPDLVDVLPLPAAS